MTGIFTLLAGPVGNAGQAAKALAHSASKLACRATSAHKQSTARRELMGLSGHVLNDIGLSRWEVDTLS